MALKDIIESDIVNVFMNTDEFCDMLNIQIGTETFNIEGSLQSNAISNNSGNGRPLQENTYTLYIKYPVGTKFVISSGTRIAINGKSFSVTSVSNEMGLATIQLSTCMGR